MKPNCERSRRYSLTEYRHTQSNPTVENISSNITINHHHQPQPLQPPGAPWGSMGDFCPKKKDVVDKLKRRIGLYRQHHQEAQGRYMNAAPDIFERQKQESLVLRQRWEESKARKAAKQPKSGRGGGGGAGGNAADGAGGGGGGAGTGNLHGGSNGGVGGNDHRNLVTVSGFSRVSSLVLVLIFFQLCRLIWICVYIFSITLH